MKTVVIFKWNRNPEDAHVHADGSVTWPGVKMSASDDDPAAMDAAKLLSPEGDIIGLTVGDGKADWAAARGASKTIAIPDATSEVGDAAVADTLAAAIRSIGDVDAVTIGDSDWNYAMVTMLIGKLGWKAYAGVIDVEVDDELIRLTVKGISESRIVETHPPLLVIAKALGNEANPPGMKQTLMARKKPLETLSMEELGVSGTCCTEETETRLPESDAAIVFDGSNPVDAAKHLIDALRDEGVL